MFGLKEPEFVIADNERVGDVSHIAFRVSSRAMVRAFHVAALAAGGKDNGAPGKRERYSPSYMPPSCMTPTA